jgi:putative transposase
MAPPRVPSRKWLEFEGDVISGCFGTVEIAVPRARIGTTGGGTGEWKSTVLPRYARMTKQVEALIAGACLAGTNTRRVRRVLAALFRGAVGKDAVSRIWRKVKMDWEAWSKRSPRKRAIAETG